MGAIYVNHRCRHGCLCSCSNPTCYFCLQDTESFIKTGLFMEGCSMVQDSPWPEDTCNQVVTWVIDHHRSYVAENGGCALGLDHDILYVATRLVIKFRLRRRRTITALLGEIFSCERCFDRLIIGAIAGPTRIIDGWKNEFESRTECLRALQLFLFHSMSVGMLFSKDGKPYKMINLPLSNGESPMFAAKKTMSGRGIGVYKMLSKYGKVKVH